MLINMLISTGHSSIGNKVTYDSFLHITIPPKTFAITVPLNPISEKIMYLSFHHSWYDIVTKPSGSLLPQLAHLLSLCLDHCVLTTYYSRLPGSHSPDLNRGITFWGKLSLMFSKEEWGNHFHPHL